MEFMQAGFGRPAHFQYSIRGLPPVFLTHATGCPYCSGASRDLGHRPVLRGTGRGNKRGVHHRAGLEQQPWAVSSSFRPRWASKLSDPGTMQEGRDRTTPQSLHYAHGEGASETLDKIHLLVLSGRLLNVCSSRAIQAHVWWRVQKVLHCEDP